MAHYITVKLLLDTEDHSDTCDAVNEILRDQQRRFTPNSALIDYIVGTPEHAGRGISRLVDTDQYEEGDMA